MNKMEYEFCNKIFKTKFEVILQKNDEIMDLASNNTIFKKELVARTTV